MGWWGNPRQAWPWWRLGRDGPEEELTPQPSDQAREEERPKCASPPFHYSSLCLPRLVSSVQAIMASTAGYIVSTSCKHIIDDQ